MRVSLPITLLDQAILSIFTVGVNLILLAIAPPEVFGKFAYTLAVVLVFGSLQNALICTPMAIYLPAQIGARHDHLLGAFWRVDVVYRIAACLIAGGIFASVSTSTPYLLAATFLLAASLWRETARGMLFATARFARCLALDTTAVLVSIAAALLLWPLLDPAVAVLAGMAVGNATAVLALARRPRSGGTTTIAALREYAAYWAEVKWSAVGAATTECQYRSYVFALEWFRGLDAVGNIQAGRVLMGPLTLSVVAWGRVARSAMAASIAGCRSSEAVAMLRNGLLLLAVAVSAYGLVLYLAWPHFEALILRGRYPEVGFLTACWFVYTIVNVTESAISVFLQAARDFRGLALSALAAAVTSLVLLGGLALDVPVFYAIAAATAGELVALCWTGALAVRLVSAVRRDVLQQAGVA